MPHPREPDTAIRSTEGSRRVDTETGPATQQEKAACGPQGDGWMKGVVGVGRRKNPVRKKVVSVGKKNSGCVEDQATRVFPTHGDGTNHPQRWIWGVHGGCEKL